MQRHSLDVLSLVLGMLFAAVGTVFLLGDVDITRVRWDWVGPAALIVVGVLVLVGARSDRRDETDTAPASGDDDPAARKRPDYPSTDGGRSASSDASTTSR